MVLLKSVLRQMDVFGNKPRKGQLKIEEDVNPNRWIGKEENLEKELRISIILF